MKDVTNSPIFLASKAPSQRRPARLPRPGFTLIELLVVISIIAIAVSVVLPSMIGLFTAGADKQARTMLATMCGAARGRAIEDQTYTAVWIQVDNQPHPRCWVAVLELDPTLLDADGRPRTFVPSTIAPRQAPGDMAYAQMLSGSNPLSGFQSIYTVGASEVFGAVVNTPPNTVPTPRVGNQVFMAVLTQAVLVFGPDGQLTNKVYGAQGGDANYFPKFGNRYAVYQNAGNTRVDFTRSRLLWSNTGLNPGLNLAVQQANNSAITSPAPALALSTSYYGSEPADALNTCILPPPYGSDDNGNTDVFNSALWGGYTTYLVSGINYNNLYEVKRLPPVVSAVTVFNYATMAAMATGDYTQNGSRANYLTANKTYIVVNPYTGQLLPNE